MSSHRGPLVLDLDEGARNWLLLALLDLRKRMALSAYKPPAGAVQLEQLLAPKSVSDRQGPSALESAAAYGEADHAVTRLGLSIEEVAAALAVSRSSVERAIRAGALPTVRLAGSVRVRVSDLDKYVASRPVINRDESNRKGAA